MGQIDFKSLLIGVLLMVVLILSAKSIMDEQRIKHLKVSKITLVDSSGIVMGRWDSNGLQLMNITTHGSNSISTIGDITAHGDIQTRSRLYAKTIVAGESKNRPQGVLTSSENGGVIYLYDSSQEPTLVFGPTKSGGGMLMGYNTKGKIAYKWGIGKVNNGYFSINDAEGNIRFAYGLRGKNASGRLYFFSAFKIK